MASMIKNNLPKVKVSFAQLSSQELLVGVPQEAAERQETGEPMNNATLAYIHENGAPAADIPARPFMRVGVENAKPRVVAFLRAGAMKATGKDSKRAVLDSLNKAGLVCAAAMKAVITAGIAPPLKAGTVAGRRYSRSTKSTRKGERAYAKAVADAISKGASASDASAAASAGTGIHPLDNTGQLKNSLTYVIRPK